jgi:glutamate racemase
VIYFGDTARVPYGSKSHRTVATFALEAARFLLQFDPKLIVAACNTASALALGELESEMPIPVVGVVDPGAAAAVRRASAGPIAVLGTEATIASGSYLAAIRTLAPEREVETCACPLFVPLVEEGRECDDPIVKLVVDTYCRALRERGVSVVVLGCTHYPLLADAITEFFGADVHIVDSGRETSAAVRETLRNMDGLCAAQRPASMRCYVSDNPARFRRVGSRFLDEDIEHVEFVPPERYITSTALESEPR